MSSRGSLSLCFLTAKLYSVPINGATTDVGGYEPGGAGCAVVSPGCSGRGRYLAGGHLLMASGPVREMAGREASHEGTKNRGGANN